MKKILIADDDPAIRSSLGQVLVVSGYAVTFAIDGAEGQARLLSGEFDLLILDLDMPVRDGWDVLEDLQTINPALPVIVLTGMRDQLETFDVCGVDALMSKPVDAETLLATVERLLACGAKRKVASAQDPVPPGHPLANLTMRL